MKFLCVVVVVVVVVVVAFIEFTLGDEAGGDQVCDIRLEETLVHVDIPDVLLPNLSRCIDPELPTLRAGIRAANTTEHLRNAMKGYCDHLPTIVACIGVVNTRIDRCLNASLSRSAKVISSDIVTFMEVVCTDDGANTAAVIEEVKNLQNRSELEVVVEKCADDAHGAVWDITDNNDSSRVSVAFYNMFQAAKSCLAGAAPGSTVFNNLVDEMFVELLKKLKCIHPESQAEVLCDTFVKK